MEMRFVPTMPDISFRDYVKRFQAMHLMMLWLRVRKSAIFDRIGFLVTRVQLLRLHIFHIVMFSLSVIILGVAGTHAQENHTSSLSSILEEIRRGHEHIENVFKESFIIFERSKSPEGSGVFQGRTVTGTWWEETAYKNENEKFLYLSLRKGKYRDESNREIDPLELLKLANLPIQSFHHAYGYNRDYVFSLSSKQYKIDAEHLDKHPWIIEELKPVDEASKKWIKDLMGCKRCLTGVLSTPALDYLMDNAVTVNRLQKTDEGVTVDFSYTGDQKKPELVGIVGGTIKFNVQNFWSIDEAVIKRKDSIWKNSIRLSETTIKGLRLPASESTHFSMNDKSQPNSDSHKDLSWRYEFNVNIPDAEFRLPAFGLVEPDFVKTGTSWWIYSPWILLVLVLGGYGIFRFWNRRS